MVRAARRSAVLALTAALLLSLFTVVPAAANNTVQGLPFAQNWSNIDLITTGDDWSGVPGVVGYLGQDPSTTTAPIDPRTFLGATSDVDVIDDQTNTAITNGGVAEFHLGNPVVALQGSGTADAPHLVFHVDTTGSPTVNVAYNLRDIDGTGDNAVQPVALQYRVGSSGTFTNVPGAFVADATTGPDLATLVTPVSVELPSDAGNQPLVEIRVITGNAVGSDEWVGVDDVSITGTVADGAPSVASMTPADGDTGVAVDATVSVAFTENVDVAGSWYTIECSTTGSHTATVAGGPDSFTIDPDTDFAPGENCTVTIVAAQVSDQDADDPPDTMAADHAVTFSTVAANPCVAAYTPIYDIQGSGPAAAITGTLTTQGVVVGDFEGTAAASGFYLQDPTGDGDAATSDGIFVFTGSANLVEAGEVVRVTGYARERFNLTTINGSNSNNAAVPAANIVDCGTGSVAHTDVSLPFSSATAPEAFEGMLVRLPQDLVIAEYFNYERFGEIVLARPLDGEARPFSPTLLEEPGDDALDRAAANLLSRITLDDVQSAQNPTVLRHPNGDPFTLANRFRGGDLVTNTVGVLGFDFSLYRILPTGPADYTAANPRPAEPEDVGGRLKVAAMNTLNYFLTLDPLDDPTNPDNPADNICGPTGTEHDCRGADLSQPLEFDRQRDKLIAALAGLDADIVGLNELENTLGVDPLGDPQTGLVAGLNEIFGAGTYAAIDTGVIGTDAIKVGLIYRPGAVTPVGDYELLTSADDPRFIDTLSRPVLAQTFEENATGARFTVAVNHLKSKSSACDAVGDPDLLDGQGNCSQTRRAAADALVDWLQTDPTGSGDRDYLIIGDLNSYAREDAIDEIRAGPDDAAGTNDDYTNLIERFGGPYAYSYVFDGQAGYLDHALSSPTLTAQVTGATEWHINADEPDLLDYDTSFKPAAQEAIYEPNAYRSSDHDPVIVGLNLLEFGFDGFLPPLPADGSHETNAGSTIPVQFTLESAAGLDVVYATQSRRVDCASGAPIGGWEATSATVGLTRDATSGLYTYDWKTLKTWGLTCRTFELTLDDGTFRQVTIHFRK